MWRTLCMWVITIVTQGQWILLDLQWIQLIRNPQRLKWCNYTVSCDLHVYNNVIKQTSQSSAVTADYEIYTVWCNTLCHMQLTLGSQYPIGAVTWVSQENLFLWSNAVRNIQKFNRLDAGNSNAGVEISSIHPLSTWHTRSNTNASVIFRTKLSRAIVIRQNYQKARKPGSTNGVNM